MPFRRKKSLMDRAHDYVEQVSETVLPHLESAWEQAVDKAGPVITDAREKTAAAHRRGPGDRRREGVRGRRAREREGHRGP